MNHMSSISSEDDGVSGRNGLVRCTAGREESHNSGADSDQNRNEELF